MYGGNSYYCHSAYYYHPYHPPYYGPAYNPAGAFVVALAATAIIVNAQNQQYTYQSGVYYVASDGGYMAVAAPIGATITTLPTGSETIIIDQSTTNYYYAGAYYEKVPDGYAVVAPTAGAVVENVPPGGTEVKIGDVTYVQIGTTYYQPIQQNGKDMYEVVEVKPDAS
jgi:hypothetical protein